MGQRGRIAAALLAVLCATSACANTPASQSAEPSAPTKAPTQLQYSSTPLPVGNNIDNYELARWSSPAPRASGVKETLLVLHNADLHFARNIGFHVTGLTASAYPKTDDQPLMLDDPTSFYIAAHQGQVVVSGEELSALLNEYTFNFKGAPLRQIRIDTRGGKLHFAGQYYRDGWVDFSMAGEISLENDHVLKFVADEVQVAGRPAAELLEAAHVKLGDILSISANGVVLSGNTIRLKVLEMFPPPELRLSVQKASITDRGVVLEVDDGVEAPKIKSIIDSDSYIVIKGGDVKIMRTVVRGANLELHSQPPGEIVDLSLYRYREQVVAGAFRLLLEPEEIFVARVPSLDAASGAPQ